MGSRTDAVKGASLLPSIQTHDEGRETDEDQCWSALLRRHAGGGGMRARVTVPIAIAIAVGLTALGIAASGFAGSGSIGQAGAATASFKDVHKAIAAGWSFKLPDKAG